MVQKVFQRLKPQMVVCKGCRVNLRDPKNQRLLGKGWKLATTHERLARDMELPCRCQQPHSLCQGSLTRMSAYYTDDFARRVCRAFLEDDGWQHLCEELQGNQRVPQQHAQSMPQCTCDLVQHPRSTQKCNVCEMMVEDPFCGVGVGEELPPLTEEEIARCQKQLSMIHRNTGHGSIENLVQALKVRKTDPRIVELAKKFKCSVCEENKRFVGRPKATLEP